MVKSCSLNKCPVEVQFLPNGFVKITPKHTYMYLLLFYITYSYFQMYHVQICVLDDDDDDDGLYTIENV